MALSRVTSFQKAPSWLFARVLDTLLVTLLLVNRVESCESASQIEEIKPLSIGDRLFLNSPSIINCEKQETFTAP